VNIEIIDSHRMHEHAAAAFVRVRKPAPHPGRIPE
jgi:hypothetical protein